MKGIHSAACVLTVALLAGDDTPRFAPTEGARLERTWESRIDLELEKWELQIDGKPFDGRLFVSDLKLELVRQLELTDTFAKVTAGRPDRVERSFTNIAATAKLTQGSENFSSDVKFVGQSPLAGERVVFERDGDAWTVDFAAESPGAPKLLEGLEQDLDLAAWLPTRVVAKGESWRVDARALDPLLRPGGALKLEFDRSGDKVGGDEILGVSPDHLVGSFEGNIDATLVAIATKDDARLARIRVEFDVRAGKDLTQREQQASDAADPEWAGTVVIDACSTALAWDADGELVWDLSAGRMCSLDLDGRLDVTYRLRTRYDGRGFRGEYDHRMLFSGKLAVKLEVSEP